MMDENLNEDHIVAILQGIPVFCVNRTYTKSTPTPAHEVQYKFKFDNNYGASVVMFKEAYRPHYLRRGPKHIYELAVLGKDDQIYYDSEITSNVERGDEFYINDLLNRIEKL